MAIVSRTLSTDKTHHRLRSVMNRILQVVFLLCLSALVGGDDSSAATAVPSLQQSSVMALAAVPSAKPLVGSILDFSPNCSAVTHIFEGRGILLAEIPQKPSNEMVLRYCESPSVGTCCTYNMETKMAMSSRLHLEKNSKEEINRLSSVLGAKAHKLNDVFNQLLAESKKEFHSMFKRTYGVIYEQNAYVFSDLFTELEKYYSRGKVDLGEAMDSFFNTLYQKMFTVLNAQFAFDDKYLGCVSEHMKELKPFGDVPDKLSLQIKRSFVATRTYAQALMTASDVTKKMMNIRLNADCTAALTKMQHCGACKGYVEKPCTNYCVNVMKGCLHYFHELDMEWDNFVSSMEKVAERLLGSFNIVMVVEPINIKISEAIMNFQEAGQDISNQVFQGCGRPSLGRKKRTISPKFVEPNSKTTMSDNMEADTMDIDATLDNEIILKESAQQRVKRTIESESDSEDVAVSDQEQNNPPKKGGGGGNGGGGGGRKNKKKQGNRKNDDSDYVTREPVLDKLIKEIRQTVKQSKKFWSNLPYQICNNEDIAALSDEDNNCWNGHTVDRYMHSVTTEHGSSNPEFPGNPTSTKQQSSVTSQLFYLKTAISHLRNAYNGQDVEWSDQEPYFGSGSGSGGGIDDEDDDDEGSGLGPGSYPTFHKPTVASGNTEHPSVRVNKIDNSDDEDDVGGVVEHTSGPGRNDGTSDNGGTHRNSHEEEDEVGDNHLNNEPKFSSATKLKNLRWSVLMYLLIPFFAVIRFSGNLHNLDFL
ncbi:glypican-4 isoform X2 [Eupeodes corollae]|uniref:glypican-4 isoform X2 n=1 Tax=Eupeodes corollae TaxID=290404 RepID=UPI002493035B|nr:glypican-4 isoform X2 [Eupeodes corollae]